MNRGYFVLTGKEVGLVHKDLQYIANCPSSRGIATLVLRKEPIILCLKERDFKILDEKSSESLSQPLHEQYRQLKDFDLESFPLYQLGRDIAERKIPEYTDREMKLVNLNELKGLRKLSYLILEFLEKILPVPFPRAI